jgi:hypothetical protein
MFALEKRIPIAIRHSKMKKDFANHHNMDVVRKLTRSNRYMFSSWRRTRVFS